MQTDPAGQQAEPREDAEDTAATAAQSLANKQGLIKLILAKSQRSYRMVIDMLVKLNLAGIDMTLAREATLAITAYQSDHIRFLPQIEVIMAGQEDRVLTRTILQALTQICGPISFNLFAKICHCLVRTKEFVKASRTLDVVEDEVATMLENHNLDTEPRPQTETAEFAQLSNAVDQKVTELNALGSADGPPANQEQPKTSRALSSIDAA